jgi:hypothetical protein
MNNKGTIRCGRYKVRYSLNGFYILTDDGRDSLYIPNREILKARAVGEIKRQGYYSNRTRKQVACSAVLETGERNFKKGCESLGIDSNVRKPQGNRIPLEEIQEAIRNFWQEQEISSNGELNTITAFRERYKREYHSRIVRKNGLKGVMSTMEPPYNALYTRVHKRRKVESANEDKVRNMLLQLDNEGLPISPSGLSTSSDERARNLSKEISYLSRNCQLMHRTPLEIIMNLTGFEKDYILGPSVALIGEKIIEFLLRTMLIEGNSLDGLLLKGEVHTTPEMRKINFNGGVYSDLRIGNHAIEVKTLSSHFSENKAIELAKRYSPCANRWDTGELVEASSVFFNCPQEFFRPFCKPIEDSGIFIFDGRVIHQLLESSLLFLFEKYPPMIDEIRPRMHAPHKSLPRFYNILCSAPKLLKHSRQRELLNYIRNYITSLTNKLNVMQNDRDR